MVDESGVVFQHLKDRVRVVVPDVDDVRRRVFEVYHTQSGHGGFAKTLARLTKFFLVAEVCS